MFYREGVIDKLIKNVKNREKAMIGKILIKGFVQGYKPAFAQSRKI